MSIWNVDAKRRQVAVLLAWGLAVLAPGPVHAQEATVSSSQCRAATSGAPVDNGTCVIRKRSVSVTTPQPAGIVNVAITCDGACAAAGRAASAAVPADAASWPAWAIAHVEAEDAMRKDDHVWRGRLMLCAGLFAGVLCGMAIWLLFRSSRQADATGLRFTSHWGGYGGSAGGWQVTPAFVSLLGAVLLAATAAIIVGGMLVAPMPAPQAQPFSLPGTAAPPVPATAKK